MGTPISLRSSSLRCLNAVMSICDKHPPSSLSLHTLVRHILLSSIVTHFDCDINIVSILKKRPRLHCVMCLYLLYVKYGPCSHAGLDFFGIREEFVLEKAVHSFLTCDHTCINLTHQGIYVQHMFDEPIDIWYRIFDPQSSRKLCPKSDPYNRIEGSQAELMKHNTLIYT